MMAHFRDLGINMMTFQKGNPFVIALKKQTTKCCCIFLTRLCRQSFSPKFLEHCCNKVLKNFFNKG